MSGKQVTQIDREIGQTIRRLRRAAGLSMADLSVGMGISYQQFAKMERGVNRFTSGRLYLVAKELGVPVSALFPAAPVTTPSFEIKFMEIAARLSPRVLKHLSLLTASLGGKVTGND